MAGPEAGAGAGAGAGASAGAAGAAGAAMLREAADGPDEAVNEAVATARLVDHHVHGILRGPIGEDRLALALSESDRPEAARAAGYDTQVWLAVRRWCAPLLGLEAGTPADAYIARRRALANEEVAAALLPAAGLERMVVDTGFRPDEVTAPDELAAIAGVPADRVVRIEAVAERVALAGTAAAAYPDAFREALASEVAGTADAAGTAGTRAVGTRAVGTKTVLAYRAGFDVDLARPTDARVAERAGAWLREVEATGRARIDDPALLLHGIWSAIDLGLPLQVHTGFGDPDLDLHRADPLLLTDLIRATEGRCPLVLLHTYPFHRGAGYLARVFPHVHLDVGLAVSHAGATAPGIVAEALELAPFSKVLYSSDGWGVPELHLLGSVLFRRALARSLGGWVAAGDWTRADALRVVRLVARENAARLYGL